MYDELIKRLRCCANEIFCRDCSYTYNCGGEKMVIQEAADAIEDLQKALDAVNDAHNEGYDVGYWAGRRDYEPTWIPVTERLPKDGAEVLAFNKTGFAYVDYRADGKWKINSMVDEEHEIVTHWMPLPQPPESEGE